MNNKGGILLMVFLVLLLIGINYNFLDDSIEEFLGSPKLAGGIVLTTDPKVVCVKGYSASVRDVSLELKQQIYDANNLSFPQPSGTVELDHIIPLELGGSNSMQNLKIQFRDPRPGYLEKDKVENYLHKQVCSGNMSLEEAQNQIAENWTEIYYKIK